MDEHERERQRRIEALSALGRGHSDPSSDAMMSASGGRDPTRRREMWRRIVLLGAVVVVLLGGALGYLVVFRPHQPVRPAKTSAAPLTLDLETANLYCPQAFAWSHDGREMAVLGADITCREQAYEGSPQGLKVGVLDTRTGALTQTLNISAPLEQQGLVTTIVSAIAWAPDDSALTVFTADAYSAATQTDNEALIVYPLKTTGRAPQVLFAPQPQNVQPIVWNLHTMKAGPTIDANLPPALTYRWTADGHIVADQSLPTATATPTGRITSNNSFSVWQDGQIVPEKVNHSHLTPAGQPPEAEFFMSSPVLWSPDQQFVTFGLRLGGPVSVTRAASNAPVCVSPGQPRDCLQPLLPRPDAAFDAVLKTAEQGETLTEFNGTSIQNWPSVPVQWSPNGKYLLTLLPGDEQREHFTTTTATVFDVATGKQVKHYQLKNSQATASCGMSAPLAWSPASGQIALAQCTPDTITILSTQGLG